MEKAILVLVDDLFFAAKIQETGKQLGVRIHTVGGEEAMRKAIGEGAASALILDLDCRSTDTVPLIRSLKADPQARNLPLVAYVRHTHTDLVREAQAAGCDPVLPRSSFFKDLPQMLKALPGAHPQAVGSP